MTPSTFGDDHQHKMTENETKVHEALEAGKVQEAQVYATLHQAEMVGTVREGIALLFRTVHHATEVFAESNTKGVTLVREMPHAPLWKATWRCGGRTSSAERPNRWEALQWAAEQPAGVRLILNPETNDWETFNADAIRMGHEAMPEEYM